MIQLEKELRALVGVVFNGRGVGNSNVCSRTHTHTGAETCQEMQTCTGTDPSLCSVNTLKHCACYFYIFYIFTVYFNCIMSVGVYLLDVCLHVCYQYSFSLFPPQLSSEWHATECAQTRVAGARAPTSVFPADISDEAAPALSPATSLMGEQFIHVHFYKRCVWADTNLCDEPKMRISPNVASL